MYPARNTQEVNERTPQRAIVEGTKCTPAEVSFVTATTPADTIETPLKGNGTGLPENSCEVVFSAYETLLDELDDEDEE